VAGGDTEQRLATLGKAGDESNVGYGSPLNTVVAWTLTKVETARACNWSTPASSHQRMIRREEHGWDGWKKVVPNIGSIGTNLEKRIEDVPHARLRWDYLDPAAEVRQDGVGVKISVQHGPWRIRIKLPAMEICIDPSVVQAPISLKASRYLRVVWWMAIGNPSADVVPHTEVGGIVNPNADGTFGGCHREFFTVIKLDDPSQRIFGSQAIPFRTRKCRMRPRGALRPSKNDHTVMMIVPGALSLRQLHLAQRACSGIWFKF